MHRLLPVSSLLCLFLVAPAMGQSGLRGHDSNAPVDVGADRIEVQDRNNRAIFSGNVVARQGDLNFSSARLVVVYANSSGSGTDIQRLEASGGVTLRNPGATARSQFAIYDVDRRIVTMIGGVTLNQGGNHVQGGRLVLDLDTNRAVMDGGTPSSGGRVTGRFTVPRRNRGN